jgi:Rhs element Vgr protein
MPDNARRLPLPPAADVVSATIKVDGSAIPATVQVSSITTSKALGRIPTARLVLVDGDPARGAFAASESALFVPGNAVEVLLGYRGQQDPVFKGIIVRHAIRARSSGASSLVLECRDPALAMSLQARSRYFSDVSDSDVISELIAAYPLQAEVAGTALTHAELVQFDSSDWDFMLCRADANGLLVNVDDGRVAVAAPDFSQAPLLTLEWGATLLAFDAELDAAAQPTRVNGVSWDPAAQQPVEAEAADPGVSVPGNLSADDLSAVLGEGRRFQHSGRLSSDEIQAWMDARALRQRLAQVRGRVTSQGLASPRPGILIELAGLGARFNGAVFVSGVGHRVSEGSWQTDLQLGLDPRSHAAQHDVDGPLAGNLLAASHGLQIGLVTQLGEDPDGEGRILVRLPVIDVDAEGVWARLSTLDAGDQRGSFFLPEIGDEVLVGFLNGDPRDPVVLGGLHSSAKPPPLEASDDNHEKGYVSRSGIKLLFNDDLASIHIETPNGNLITLSDDDGGVTISDENGNQIALSSDGIALTSAADLTLEASGDISIKGSNVTIEASAALGASGSASAELGSDGSTTVKGSVVMIN